MYTFLRDITTFFFGIKMVLSISPYKELHSTDASVGDIVEYIASKGYIPDENELPRTPLIKSNDNDATYILSKLSDEELLKLLNEQPQRNEYNLNDIMRIAFDTKTMQESRFQPLREYKQNGNRNILENLSMDRKRFRPVTNNEPPAYFRLNHKTVDPYKGRSDSNYIALQKLKKLLNIYPQPKTEDIFDAYDNKKQVLFDILVAQLKSLCCKSSNNAESNKGQYKSFVNERLPSLVNHQVNIPNHISTPIDLDKYKEFMFLIINDEIKSNGSDELLEVDPESLDGNSSVLLLGPVSTPLNDDELKLVMSRISNELAKPEYVSLLQQLSDGVLGENNNKNVMKNFIFGSKTRRYIKPHRCNHQSKLAKIYGGPKWIVCTGYINLNKPSLYD